MMKNRILFLLISLAFLIALSGSTIKTFAWATTLFAVWIAGASLLTGYLCDRFAASKVLIAGAIFNILAFAGLGAIDHVGAFIWIYGGLGPLAFSFTANVPLVMWLNQLSQGHGAAKRYLGRAYALISAGPAAAYMLVIPLWFSYKIKFLGARRCCGLHFILWSLFCQPH